MRCNDKKLIDSPCLRTESYSGFLLAECSVIKRGALALSVTSILILCVVPIFYFPVLRPRSSVPVSRLLLMYLVLTYLIPSYLYLLTYLPTYLTTQPVTYLLTYLLYTHSLFTQSLTDSFTFTYYRKHNYYSLHRNCNRIEYAARAFWEIPKTDFVFWGANPKTNHGSMILWVDSSHQIQIRIFEIHNLGV